MPTTRIHRIDRIITCIHVPSPSRVQLCPSSQRWIVAARAELVQAGAAIEVAASELPGVVQAALLLLTDDVAIGVIDVAIDIVASAVRHPHNRAQAVEEVIILLGVGRALMVEETTATAHKVRRSTGICACRQSQPRIHEGIRIDLDAVRLVCSTIGVGVAANLRGLVLRIIPARCALTFSNPIHCI